MTFFSPLRYLAAAALMSGSALSFAQPMMGPGPGGPHCGSELRGRIMEKHMARHQEALKKKLQLSAAQQPAWEAFAQSMKPPSFQGMDRNAWQALEKLPTPGRIDRMQALHKQHSEAMTQDMQARAQATKTFYAQLSPEQQKVFDSETASHHRKGWFHGAGADAGAGEKK